jgi:serine protease AprX
MIQAIKVLLFFIFVFVFQQASSQSRYIVKFKNKGFNTFTLANPSAYLSAISIERRTKYNLTIDSTDLPVTKRYLDSLASVPNVTLLNVSKWLNQVSIHTTDAEAINKIKSFSFVQTVSEIALRKVNDPSTEVSKKFQEPNNTLPLSPLLRTTNTSSNYFNYGQSLDQVKIHNGEFLHNIGLRGQNMNIGMLDAGYYGYLSLSAFDSVRANGQILDTWDFVNREASVNEDHPHGMYCFSIMAANIPGQFVGTAPKANYYLYMTEDVYSEYPIEEHNWVCGAERVDSSGGYVISSSLGYYLFDSPLQHLNYSYADMNGNSTIAVMGADLAAKKGILVVNAAGNEGGSSWNYIITPADGDSVLAVGAVNTNGVPGGFSSYGPSSDGQVKPDVASVGVGTIIQYTNNTIGPGNGTSFACPNMAGLATCLWQGFQEVNNMKIVDVLKRSANKYTTPDDRIGYGIPDMKKAVLLLLNETATSKVSIINCGVGLEWASREVAGMRYEIERKLPGQNNYLKIGDKLATGNTFINRTHQFSDTTSSLPVGEISYRIRQIIDTSSAGFSAAYIDTVAVTITASCGNQPQDKSFLLAPNPAYSSFSIQLNFAEAIPNMQIRITDAAGRIVSNFTRNKAEGMSFIPVPANHLAQGKYFVSIYNQQKLIGTKELLIIKR